MMGLTTWKGYAEKTEEPIEALIAHAPVVYNKGAEKHNENPLRKYDIGKVAEPTKEDIDTKAATKKFKCLFCFRLFQHYSTLGRHLHIHNV